MDAKLPHNLHTTNTTPLLNNPTNQLLPQNLSNNTTTNPNPNLNNPISLLNNNTPQNNHTDSNHQANSPWTAHLTVSATNSTKPKKNAKTSFLQKWKVHVCVLYI